jgi:hypothetical protein
MARRDSTQCHTPISGAIYRTLSRTGAARLLVWSKDKAVVDTARFDRWRLTSQCTSFIHIFFFQDGIMPFIVKCSSRTLYTLMSSRNSPYVPLSSPFRHCVWDSKILGTQKVNIEPQIKQRTLLPEMRTDSIEHEAPSPYVPHNIGTKAGSSITADTSGWAAVHYLMRMRCCADRESSRFSRRVVGEIRTGRCLFTTGWGRSGS